MTGQPIDLPHLRHPCFNPLVRGRYGRMHLPVAPRCNLQCGYCDRRSACVNESRPGVSARVLTPDEACGIAARAVRLHPEITVAGIAGPGDPLASPRETMATMERLRRELPGLILCLSPNGLALPEHADRLADLGVGHVTVTVNTVDPADGARHYRSVDGLAGEEGAALVLERQERGIRLLKRRGVVVKVNTVVVPGVNDACVEETARAVAGWGADLMNCIALIPVPGTLLGDRPAPDAALMRSVRERAGRHVPQMLHCARCRADAFGLLGSGGVLEGCGVGAGEEVPGRALCGAC